MKKMFSQFVSHDISAYRFVSFLYEPRNSIIYDDHTLLFHEENIFCCHRFPTQWVSKLK